MLLNHVNLIGVSLAVVLVASGCSSTGLKQENTDLKLRVQQEEQTRQDYADKMRAALEATEQERLRSNAEMSAMRRDLDAVLQEKNVIVKKIEDLTVIEMEYSVLFKSGQAELSKEGVTVVKKIATAFKKYPGYHMRVEGHTDNMPINSKLKQRYYSNWELSAARAATVVRYMIFAQSVPGKNLSIAGYADHRPIASNDSNDGRAKNRRIRVVIFKK